MISYEEAKTTLTQHDQQHVLQFWDQLEGTAQNSLLKQISANDFASISAQQAMLDQESSEAAGEPIEPAPVTELDALAHREKAVAFHGAAGSSCGEAGLSRGHTARECPPPLSDDPPICHHR